MAEVVKKPVTEVAGWFDPLKSMLRGDQVDLNSARSRIGLYINILFAIFLVGSACSLWRDSREAAAGPSLFEMLCIFCFISNSIIVLNLFQGSIPRNCVAWIGAFLAFGLGMTLV